MKQTSFVSTLRQQCCRHRRLTLRALRHRRPQLLALNSLRRPPLHHCLDLAHMTIDAASFAEVGEHAGHDMDVERGSQSPLRDESELRHSPHLLVAMLCNPPREVLQQAGVTFDDSGKAQWLPCDSDESDAQDLASEAVLGEQGVDGCGDGIAGQDAFLQQPYAVQQSSDNTCALGDEQDNDSLVVR